MKRKQKQATRNLETLIVTLKVDTRAFEKKLAALERRIVRLQKAAAGVRA